MDLVAGSKVMLLKRFKSSGVPKTNLGTRFSNLGTRLSNLGTRLFISFSYGNYLPTHSYSYKVRSRDSRYEVSLSERSQDSHYEVCLSGRGLDSRYEVSLRNALILILFLLSISLSATDILTLKGEAVQGGFLIGELSEDVEQVFWNYEKVNIFNHQFIMGFDRDEKLRHIITLCEKNGEMHNLTITLTPREYYIQKINKIQKKYVKQPTDAKLTKRIDDESELLKIARKSINNNQFHYFDRFIRPIENGRISSSFGNQRILNGVPKRPHNGIDIAVPEGTEIKAMTSGVVKITGDFFYNGKFVLIDHGAGLSSIYLHMSKIDVEKGEYVVAGDKIGEVGSTGRSTGNHLHWGVNWYKDRIDPEAFLKLDEVFLKLRKNTPVNE